MRRSSFFFNGLTRIFSKKTLGWESCTSTLSYISESQFWTDLRLARKIYSNKAIKKQESINFDTPNPVVNQARAVGKRVSTFITSPFVANTNNDNASDINNGDQSELNSASIPHGIVDQQRTVVETIAEEGRESDLSNV